MSNNSLSIPFDKTRVRDLETAQIVVVCLLHHHTRYKNNKSTKNINYRQSGEEALGETIRLIENAFLITKLLHIMFEDCESVDTITVETNRRETINKQLRKRIACKIKK